MASSEGFTRVMCSLCHKAKGIYRCEGCSQYFCQKHSIDHRTALNKQLEEITITHDLLNQTLNQQSEDSHKHPLIQQINQWEEKSIDIIRTRAEELRQSLNGVIEDGTEIKQELQSLSRELRQGQDENDFSEIDLRQWTKRLEELKMELMNPTGITLQEDTVSLINKIYIIRHAKSDAFERVFSNAEIAEDGLLVIKDGSNSHTEIRGKGEYNAGRHKIGFRVEHLDQGGWIFFGIISKSQRLQGCSYTSPSSHGWSNQRQIYSSSEAVYGETLDIIQNDIVLLTIDCSQRKIQLTNKRLNHSIELPIDIEKCPFPWQVHLNLHQANSQVRIMNAIE